MDAHVRCRQDSSHVRYCYLDIDQLSYKRRASPYGSVMPRGVVVALVPDPACRAFSALCLFCAEFITFLTFRNAEDMTIIYHIDT
jgi:hypothetical protein